MYFWVNAPAVVTFLTRSSFGTDPLKTAKGTLNVKSVWAAIKLDSPDARILQVTGHDQSEYDGVTFSWDGTFMKFDGRILGTERAIE